MSVLAKQEAEIKLNGGMNTTEGAEYQSIETLRNVTDLRINADGEYEKRPDVQSVVAVTDSSNGAHTNLTTDGLVESRGDVYAITRSFGALSANGKILGSGGDIVTATQPPFSSSLIPLSTRVGRLTVDRASASNTDQGFHSNASCTYNSTTLVMASVSYSSAALGCVLRLQAVDISTGALVASVAYDNDIASSVAWAVDACENTDATAPGAVITWAMGAAAPYTIRKYRYIASSKSFVYDLALTTDASFVKHRIKTSPTAAGRFILAFNLNTGNVLRAYDIACTAGTIGTAISSHAGTHAAGGGIDIAMSGTSILIVSISSLALANSIYAERYGTPGTFITLITAAGTDSYISIAAARETSVGVATRAIVAATLDNSFGVRGCVETKYGMLDFATTTVVETLSFGFTSTDNSFLIGFGVSLSDRAYFLAGLAQTKTVEEPSAVWVRAGMVYGSTWMLANPVGRVAHDILSIPVTQTYYQNPFSTFSVGSTLYSVVTTDASEIDMDADSRPIAQTLSLVRCEIGIPSTFAKKDDVATVASGVLYDIDGMNTMCSQHLMKPFVQLDVSGGTGSTGTFSVTAISRWVDAAGREHRSAPAVPVSTGAIVNKSINVYVSTPPFASFPDTVGVRTYSMDVYITANGGSAYYLAATSTTKFTAYSEVVGARVYVGVPAGTAANPQAYSLGDADDVLVSEPPPSGLAIATIGDRMWLIDAEDRTRIWFSKTFEDGYAVEWNTANTLTIGEEGAGVADVNGVPTVFGADGGIWQIYGDGPNNLGAGTFAPARRLPHEVACLDPLSVCKTPHGIVFRARQGVRMLANDLSMQPIGAPIDASLTATYTGYCRIAYDGNMEELHLIDFDGAHFVFNMPEGKWTQWSQADYDWQDVLCSKGKVYYPVRVGSTDTVYRDKLITEANYRLHYYTWSLQTPWIRFDGVTGRLRVRELVIQVRLGTPVSSALQMTVVYETRDGAQETFEFYASDFLALGTAGQTVDLRCHIKNQRTKAFSVRIYESYDELAYTSATPIAMRVIYSTMPQGDRKKNVNALKGSV